MIIDIDTLPDQEDDNYRHKSHESHLTGRNAMMTQAVDPFSIPLNNIDPSDPMLFHRNQHEPYFKRLRAEDPVHYCAESPFGPYWSVTRYNDILEVDNNHRVFSSAGAVSLNQAVTQGVTEDATEVGGFINLDPPKHDNQRKMVSTAFMPKNLARLEDLIRERTAGVLGSLPIGTEFDWVETVAVKLTLLMLATLLDFPLADPAKLKLWSDMVSGVPGDGLVDSWEHRDACLKQMARYFIELREVRRKSEPSSDLISMMVHSPLAKGMSDIDYVSDISLLIVGGNDTTRNSMSGGVIAFHDNPDQWAKLKANPQLVESAIPETIRWQTPVIYQARRALSDYVLSGTTIHARDKVALWYISGNRDEVAIEDANRFIIDRERPRQHLAFGFGIHRCLGNRLAEMQLRILWQEVLNQGWDHIEVTGTPRYAISNVLHGIDELPVRIHA
jgi:cytochrome P450